MLNVFKQYKVQYRHQNHEHFFLYRMQRLLTFKCNRFFFPSSTWKNAKDETRTFFWVVKFFFFNNLSGLLQVVPGEKEKLFAKNFCRNVQVPG